MHGSSVLNYWSFCVRRSSKSCQVKCENSANKENIYATNPIKWNDLTWRSLEWNQYDSQSTSSQFRLCHSLCLSNAQHLRNSSLLCHSSSRSLLCQHWVDEAYESAGCSRRLTKCMFHHRIRGPLAFKWALVGSTYFLCLVGYAIVKQCPYTYML